ncbi:MAG: hypothetical protein IIA59_13385 [Candidatus Marinimicrobia bacterium]|nr:hypothetical protein [Candidatus Neomarinimicrobiota bacterium]
MERYKKGDNQLFNATMPRDAAQALADGLREVGFRPGCGTPGKFSSHHLSIDNSLRNEAAKYRSVN